MRWLAEDLERQIERATDPSQCARLQAQLEGIRREQAYDRQVSPRSKKPTIGKPRKRGRR